MFHSLRRRIGVCVRNKGFRTWPRFRRFVNLSLDVLEARVTPSAVQFAGAPYTQNFDTLIADGFDKPWINDSTLSAWSLFNKTPAAITKINADDGGNNTRTFYSFGTGTTSDRALGAIGGSDAYFG